jgi:hypothetical protein
MSIFNCESAYTLARERVDHLARAVGDNFEILTASTREIEEGWVFFFNTKDFVQTGNPASALAGNGPLLVTRGGAIHQLPSSIPWEVAVKQIAHEGHNVYPGRLKD